MRRFSQFMLNPLVSARLSKLSNKSNQYLGDHLGTVGLYARQGKAKFDKLKDSLHNLIISHLGSQTIISDFDSHCLPYTYSLVPNKNYLNKWQL